MLETTTTKKTKRCDAENYSKKIQLLQLNLIIFLSGVCLQTPHLIGDFVLEYV